MPDSLVELLNPEKGLIFRVTHVSNLEWTLRNGLHSHGSGMTDPDFVRIGNAELIELRRIRDVPMPPGGTLDDYIPFYFTPFSPMLYNIKTGYGGIQRVGNEQIAVLVSSIEKLEQHDVRYVFTDRHAYLETARFYSKPSMLSSAVDWPLLQRKDFRRDPEDPGKLERYQAEALAFRHVPAGALLGVGCYTSAFRDEIQATCADLGVDLKIVVRAEWYF